MKKLILFSALVLPSFVFAAPTGQQVCFDQSKTVKVSFGTYALSGPPVVISVNGTDFLLEAEYGETGSIYMSKNQGAMCNCGLEDGPRVGAGVLKISGVPESAKQATLYLDIQTPWNPATPRIAFKDLALTCEETEFKPGNEQN